MMHEIIMYFGDSNIIYIFKSQYLNFQCKYCNYVCTQFNNKYTKYHFYRILTAIQNKNICI
jgi:hypothetical protein